MLIDGYVVLNELNSRNIKINGVLHIGAHECEELQFYTNILKITASDIIWVEAMQNKVDENISKGIPNQYQAVISDNDNNIVTFNIANNGQSSSILEFGTHLLEHPHVQFVEQQMLRTKTIETLYKENNIDAKKYNFWNLDIQGAELLALKGAKDNILFADAIYVEVNDRELYRECALFNELDDFLRNNGFRCVIKQMCANHGWGDALYCRIDKNQLIN